MEVSTKLPFERLILLIHWNTVCGLFIRGHRSICDSAAGQRNSSCIGTERSDVQDQQRQTGGRNKMVTFIISYFVMCR